MRVIYQDTGIVCEPTSDEEIEILYRKTLLDRVLETIGLRMNPWAFLEFGYSKLGDEKKVRGVRYLRSLEEEHGIRFRFAGGLVWVREI